ncbi:MAG: hypothetical protein MUD01_23655, partial [Chloroflexaceae bacterium]|nr:hypothetical protein [Chloroflexaceae bacterium]
GRLIAQPPPTHDLPDLLAVLCVAGAQQAERPARRSLLPFRAPPPLAPNDALFSAVLALPYEQRQSLALGQLLGYDAPLAAHISGGSAEEERSRLSTALQRLARPAGMALPYESQTDECPTVRRRISELGEVSHSDAATRAHLAICSACRSFDRAWAELTRTTEADVRHTLRDRNLPTALKQELLQLVRPPVRWHQHGLLRLGGLMGAVVLLLAYLVLPGFFRAPPEEETALATSSPPADPRTLVQQALAASELTPGQNNGVWRGVWEIFWYFADGTYAPLRAEAWVDGRNPARHRLQLSHSSGGAPYELQLADGQGQIWYALDPIYYPVLYASEAGRLSTSPDLVSWRMEPAAQEQARRARIVSGAWDLGAAYLRQAAAANLRTLGRQRDGGRTVQIISFSGSSPLEVPPDAPGNPGPITILLAIDTADGRLRSVTELVGPRGGSQTSRVTWRLREEGWLATPNQINTAFDITQAWNGRGTFNSRRNNRNGDPTLMLLGNTDLTSPVELLNRPPYFVPAVPPPGVERLLVHDCSGLWYPNSCRNGPTGGISYIGPGRWLYLAVNPNIGMAGQEQLQLGLWELGLQAFKGNFYRIALKPTETTQQQQPEIPAGMVLESRGFSRAELLDVIGNLKPLDSASLRANIELLAQPLTEHEQAKAMLLEALASVQPPAPGQVLTWRERSYVRHNPELVMPTDPYSRRPYNGWPEITVNNQWITANASSATGASAQEELANAWYSTPISYTSLVRMGTEQGQPLAGWYGGAPQSWAYDAQTQVLRVWNGPGLVDENAAFSDADGQLQQLLSQPTTAVSLTMHTLPNGTRVVTATEAVAENAPRWGYLLQEGNQESWPFIRDLNPVQMLMEFTIPPNSRVSAMRLYAVPPDGLQVSIDGGPFNVVTTSPNNDMLTLLLPDQRQVNVPRSLVQDSQGQVEFRIGASNVTVRGSVDSGPVLVRSWEMLDERRTTLDDAPPELKEGTLPQALVTISADHLTTITPRTINASDTAAFQQAVQQAPYAMFLFPPNVGATITQMSRVAGTGDSFDDAYRAEIADRFNAYWNEGSSNTDFAIIQGPAEQLRAVLRANWNAPWTNLQPRRVTIAGREVEAWYTERSPTNWQGYLFAELDGTLLVVQAPDRFFESNGLATLATMRRAN